MTVESALLDAEKKMKGAISVLHEELAGIRTGRATPALLNRINVDYYGSTVPMNQLASFSVPEPRLLVIQPFDKGVSPWLTQRWQAPAPEDETPVPPPLRSQPHSRHRGFAGRARR